jgi:hypothetical protein
MIDYRSTGLPQDATVYKAYMTYVKNAKDFTAETGLSEDFGIRIAQVINSTAGADPQLLSLALLSTTPPATWGLLEKSFSKDLVSQMDESALHTRTGYAYIDQASEPVKLLAMASAIAIFDEMKAKSDKLGNLSIDPMAGPEQLEAILPSILGGVMPDTSLYGQLGRSLSSKTSSPALEQLFEEKLEEFKIAQEEQREKLAELGIVIMGPGMSPLGAAPAEVRYPSFEETGLLDDTKVRAAYETITGNPRMLPEDFEGALAAGKILSDIASKNPTTVAAALLDIGLRSLNNDDFAFLEKKIDWDVLDLLKKYGVRNVQGSDQLLASPVEFRQIVVANLTGTLEHIREGTDAALARLSEPQDDMPAEMQVPPQLRALVEAQAIQQLQAITVMARRLVQPILGTLDAPELATAFNKRVGEIADYIAAHEPKEPPAMPPGMQRRTRPPGTNFDFG